MSTAPAKQLPSLQHQAFWLLLSKTFVALVNIALPILLVRLMSQNDYGIYKQAFMFTTTAAVASMGVGQSAFYFMPRYPERTGQIVLNILIYNLLAGGLVLTVLTMFPQLLQKMARTDALNPYAPILGGIVLLSLTSSLAQSVPTAMQDVKASTMFIVGAQLMKALLFVGSALLFPAFQSFIIASLISNLLVNVALYRYFYLKCGAFWKQFDWSFFKQQLGYALPLGVFMLLYIVRRDMHSYFVSASLGPADFAIYIVGCMQVPFVFVFMESIGPLLVVRVSALQKQEKHEEVRRVVASAINRVAAVHFPACALLLVTGHDLIVLLYTERYEASYSVFAINLLLLPLTVFVVDSIVRCYAEIKVYILVVRITLIVILIAIFPFILQRFGMIGAVSAAVSVEFAERVVYGWRSAKVTGAKRKDIVLFSDLGKIALVCVGAGLLSTLVRDAINPHMLMLRIAAVSVCFGGMYLAAVYFLHLPGWQEMHPKRLLALIRHRS